MSIIQVHIVLGALGLISGFVAIASKKGGFIHRCGGIGFLLFMGLSIALGIVGAVLKPERITVIAGVFALYLMLTGWLAIKQEWAARRSINRKR